MWLFVAPKLTVFGTMRWSLQMTLLVKQLITRTPEEGALTAAANSISVSVPRVSHHHAEQPKYLPLSRSIGRNSIDDMPGLLQKPDRFGRRHGRSPSTKVPGQRSR